MNSPFREGVKVKQTCPTSLLQALKEMESSLRLGDKPDHKLYLLIVLLKVHESLFFSRPVP